jgi:O-methyltransferase involved in polyketide biosynthesis
MAKTDRGAFNKSESERLPSTEEMSADGRVVTDAERKDLIEDAKAFRASHERTFRLLSEGDN